jgi:hypothetical protein
MEARVLSFDLPASSITALIRLIGEASAAERRPLKI